MKIYPIYQQQKTEEFLSLCLKYGIKEVSVGIPHESIPDSSMFPHRKDTVATNAVNYEMWPAIWKVVRDLKIDGGCGNNYQYFLKNGHPLILGVYHYRHGKWKRIAYA